MVTVVRDPKLGWTKEKVVPALHRCNIDCRPFFPVKLPAYRSSPAAAAARERNSASYAVSPPYGVNLPSALSLTEEDVTFVASRVKILLRGD
jgi:perosamine synthetase